jgi:hypothetical protein
VNEDGSFDDHQAILSVITGSWVTQAVRAIAELHIADHATDGPISVEDVARIEESDSGATFRLRLPPAGVITRAVSVMAVGGSPRRAGTA